MSRKSHRTASSIPAARQPSAARHRRRRRGIRHVRPAVTPLASHVAVAPRTRNTARESPDRLLLFSGWILLGVTCALAWLGVTENLGAILDAPFAPAANPPILLVAVVACAACVIHYIRLEKRIYQWATRSASDAVDISFIALTAGLSVLLLPLLLSVAESSALLIYLKFALSDWPLRALQFALLAGACFLPMLGIWLLTGRLKSHRDETFTRGLALSLGAMGLAGGLLAARCLELHPTMLLTAASLPVLGFAAAAAIRTPPRSNALSN